MSPSRESVKRGKFKVCPGDVPYPLGAPEFEGSSPRAFPFQPAVSTAPAQKGRCVRPPPRHFTLPRRMPPAGAEERRGGKSGAGGPRPLPHPRAGTMRQPGEQGSAAAGPSGGGGAPSARARVLTRWGRAGTGCPQHRRPGRAQPSAAPAASLGKRGETGRRRRCRRCCHRAINTGSAHTRRRLRRAPSAKCAGRGPGSRSARATAPRR